MDKPPPPNLVFKYFKPKDSPHKAQGMSLLAFILAVLVYIYVFSSLNISPSKLFYNTKFWFFISNTLIIIIAMDYGSFSSSSNAIYKHSTLYYEPLTVREVKTSTAPSFPPIMYPNVVIDDQSCIPEEEVKIEIQPKKKATHRRKKPAGPAETRPRISSPEENIKAIALYENEGSDEKENVPPTSLPVKSRAVKKVAFDESKNIVRTMETEKQEPAAPHLVDHNSQERSEYANMSNEELNRRVEEFIERFNMQIRLQEQEYTKAR